MRKPILTLPVGTGGAAAVARWPRTAGSGRDPRAGWPFAAQPALPGSRARPGPTATGPRLQRNPRRLCSRGPAQTKSRPSGPGSPNRLVLGRPAREGGARPALARSALSTPLSQSRRAAPFGRPQMRLSAGVRAGLRPPRGAETPSAASPPPPPCAVLSAGCVCGWRSLASPLETRGELPGSACAGSRPGVHCATLRGHRGPV